MEETGVIKIKKDPNPFISSTITREELLKIASEPISRRPIRSKVVDISLAEAMTNKILAIMTNSSGEEHVYVSADKQLYVYTFFTKAEIESLSPVAYAFMAVTSSGSDPELISVIHAHVLNNGQSRVAGDEIFPSRKSRVNAREIDQWLRMGTAQLWNVFIDPFQR